MQGNRKFHWSVQRIVLFDPDGVVKGVVYPDEGTGWSWYVRQENSGGVAKSMPEAMAAVESFLNVTVEKSERGE